MVLFSLPYFLNVKYLDSFASHYYYDYFKNHITSWYTYIKIDMNEKFTVPKIPEYRFNLYGTLRPCKPRSFSITTYGVDTQVKISNLVLESQTDVRCAQDFKVSI